MINFLNYNFMSDINALDPVPTNVNDISILRIRNGIFNHLDITQDVDFPYNTNIPTWDFKTILDANFNGNISGGNLDVLLNSFDTISIKRKLHKAPDTEWVTLKTYNNITTIEQLSFVFEDNLAQGYQKYDYAFVPSKLGVEGFYVVNNIDTKFNGVFICEADLIYRLYAETEFGGIAQVQKVGVLEPIGSQFPVITSNGVVNYKTGSMGGLIEPNLEQENQIKQISLNTKGNSFIECFYPLIGITNGSSKVLIDNVEYTIQQQSGQYSFYIMETLPVFNTVSESEYKPIVITNIYPEFNDSTRGDMSIERDKLLEFLTDKKPKILKDWNGNSILMIVTGEPSVDFTNEWGGGKMNINFDYVETGNVNSQKDLKRNGLVN